MGCIAAGVHDVIQDGHQMANILDFTKNSNLPGKLENWEYFLLDLYNVIELNILLLLLAF